MGAETGTRLRTADVDAATAARLGLGALAVDTAGEPLYLELEGGDPPTGVPGGALADDGALVAVKATGSRLEAAALAMYSSATGPGGKLDRFALLGAAALDRRIRFSPLSWEERLHVPGGEVRVLVQPWQQDAIVILVDGPAEQEWELEVACDAEVLRWPECVGLLRPVLLPVEVRAALHGDDTVSIWREGQCARFEERGSIGSGGWRAISASRPLRSLRTDLRDDGYRITATAAAGPAPLVVAIAFGDDLEPCLRSAAQVCAAASADVEAAWSRPAARWAQHMARVPPAAPDVTGPDTRTGELAQAALRSILYAPRRRMTRWGSTPTKGAFNGFWGWDTAWQALGYAQWDVHRGTAQDGHGLAEQQCLLLLDAVLEDGRLPTFVDDDLRPAPYASIESQPPTVGWVSEEVAWSLPPVRRALFAAEMLPGLATIGRWWADHRDGDGDGLCSWGSGFESGWDDSPRLVGVGAAWLDSGRSAADIAAVDLNGWLAALWSGIARLARVHGPQDLWREAEARAAALERLITDHLWDEGRGAWLDRRRGADGALTDVGIRTPALWWPAFLGVATSPAQARAVRSHILDSGFQTAMPIPSVARDDAAYDVSGGGHYWQGQCWMVHQFSAVVALERHGYHDDAQRLRRAILEALRHRGGLWECYDSDSGAPGWGHAGAPLVSAAQYGWTAALASLLVSGRHAPVRDLLPETGEAAGWMRSLRAAGRPRGAAWELSGGLARLRVRPARGDSLLGAARWIVEVDDADAGATASDGTSLRPGARVEVGNPMAAG